MRASEDLRIVEKAAAYTLRIEIDASGVRYPFYHPTEPRRLLASVTARTSAGELDIRYDAANSSGARVEATIMASALLRVAILMDELASMGAHGLAALVRVELQDESDLTPDEIDQLVGQITR